MVDTPRTVDRLHDLFGPGRGKPASERAIARGLGVSRGTVHRLLSGQPTPTGEKAWAAAERAEARRPQWLDTGDDRGEASKLIPLGEVHLPDSRDIRGHLEAVAVRRPDGSIDRKATGSAFGVSPSTVGRWLRGESRPKMANQLELRREVRAQALTRSDEAMQLANTGGAIRLGFKVRISSDTRNRTGIRRSLTMSEMRQMQSAWLNGGEEALQQWLAADIEDNYFGNSLNPPDPDDCEVLEITQVTLF